MEKVTVEIHKNDKCPICLEPFMEDGQIKKPAGVKSDIIGLVHDACFFPYFKEEHLKILFQIRCFSIGDTIASTPILRELRRLYPRAEIAVLTFFPDLFKYNQHIQMIFDLNKPIYEHELAPYAFRVDAFDESKGGHFAMHSLEFSAMSAFGRSLNQNDWGYEVNYAEDDTKNMLFVLEKHGIDTFDKVVVINPHGTQWETRDWGIKHGKELVKRIKEKYPDHKIVSIGGKRAEVPSNQMLNYNQIDDCIDLYGKLTLLETISFLDQDCVKLVITPDTGTLHLAACAKAPIIGIFTLIKSEFRTPVRNQRLGYKFVGVNADNPCNCTYTNRFITDEATFERCPKKTFLQKTLDLKVPKEIKYEGMRNYGGGWIKSNIDNEIKHELKKFDSLPCFPTVEKVLRVVDVFLD